MSDYDGQQDEDEWAAMFEWAAMLDVDEDGDCYCVHCAEGRLEDEASAQGE